MFVLTIFKIKKSLRKEEENKEKYSDGILL